MPGSPADPIGATLTTRTEAGGTVLAFAGTLDSVASGTIWRDAMNAAAAQPRLILDLAALTACDTPAPPCSPNSPAAPPMDKPAKSATPAPRSRPCWIASRQSVPPRPRPRRRR